MKVHTIGNVLECSPIDGVQGFFVPMVVVMVPSEWTADKDVAIQRCSELAAEVSARLQLPDIRKIFLDSEELWDHGTYTPKDPSVDPDETVESGGPD